MSTRHKTYIAYGKRGEQNKLRQKKQDKNAASMDEEAIVERSCAKASKHYVNSGWDIVDAVKNKEIDIDKIRDDDLPKEMRGMTNKQKREYVKRMLKKRTAIQEKINRLHRERNKYIANKRKKSASKNTLDAAIIKTVREQAVRKNFVF